MLTPTTTISRSYSPAKRRIGRMRRVLSRMPAIASGCHCSQVNPNGMMAKSSPSMPCKSQLRTEQWYVFALNQQRKERVHMDTRTFFITVSGLSESDLDKEVTFPWGQQQAGDALSAALTHALTHAGGIAGIRGIGGFPVPPGY